MVVGLKSLLKQGGKLPATLEFEKAVRSKFRSISRALARRGRLRDPVHGGKMDAKSMPAGMKV
jgi:hypothetical protein